MSDDSIIQPSETRAEIVVMVGDQAKIMLDRDERGDGPPALCILGSGVQLTLYPHGWAEIGKVRQCDLERASDLVIDIVRFRDAIHAKLKAQRAEEEAAEASALRAEEERQAAEALTKTEVASEETGDARPLKREVI